MSARLDAAIAELQLPPGVTVGWRRENIPDSHTADGQILPAYSRHLLWCEWAVDGRIEAAEISFADEQMDLMHYEVLRGVLRGLVHQALNRVMGA